MKNTNEILYIKNSVRMKREMISFDNITGCSMPKVLINS
jgi:hypothetical protein